MPELRLRGSLRGWPNPNHINLWVATGDYTVAGSGSPTLSANAPILITNKKISRKSARKKTWKNSNTSFLLHNWKRAAHEMQLIWAYKSEGSKVSVTITLEVNTEVDDLEYTAMVTSTVTESVTNKKLYTAPVFDRCTTLNTAHLDNGFGTRAGWGIYRFGKIEFYLTPIEIEID